MGVLGKKPAGIVDTLVYEVPASRQAVVTVACTNTGEATTATISVVKYADFKLSGITVSSAGAGYDSSIIGKTVNINGVGNGAVAAVSKAKITSIGALTGGTRYKLNDVLTYQGGTPNTQAQITVTGVDANGVITAFDVTQAGSYTAVATSGSASFSGGTGSGVTVLYSNIKYGVVDVTLTNSGNDFTGATTATMAAPSGGTAPVLSVTLVAADVELEDAIEFDVPLSRGAVLERTGLVLGAGDKVFVRCGNAVVNTFVFGIEELA